MSPEAFRLLAAFIGIVLLVLLVARLKWHPFLALMFISWGLGRDLRDRSGSSDCGILQGLW